MNIQEKIDSFVNRGYEPILVNKSGLNTTVMYKNKKVVRIGFDSAYDHYANLITSKTIQSENAPVINKHETPRGKFGSTHLAYSCTEMELLDELNSTEAIQYQEWIDQEIQNICKNNTGITDPFNILSLTIELTSYAIKNNLKLDLTQAKNVMKRGSTFVHIDPFG